MKSHTVKLLVGSKSGVGEIQGQTRKQIVCGCNKMGPQVTSRPGTRRSQKHACQGWLVEDMVEKNVEVEDGSEKFSA